MLDTFQTSCSSVIIESCFMPAGQLSAALSAGSSNRSRTGRRGSPNRRGDAVQEGVAPARADVAPAQGHQ